MHKLSEKSSKIVPLGAPLFKPEDLTGTVLVLWTSQ
jgi:hypothetical protein